MKTRMLTFLMLAAATLPAAAQDKPKPERLPEPEAKLPTEPCCGNKVLWVDYWIPVRTLYARDYVTRETCGTWTVLYKDEEQTFTETIIQPREIEKEVTYYTTEPITTTDPTTGAVKTCMQQVPHTKKVKETIFEAVPAKRTIKVAKAYLAPDTAEILHKYTLYEWMTDMVKKGCAVSMPGGETANTHQCIVAPAPCLPHEGPITSGEKAGK
jgi:hypothetical protein